jgi:hypothetical protein
MEDDDNFFNLQPLSGIVKKRVGLRDSQANGVSGLDFISMPNFENQRSKQFKG